jgi:hypothetical protein
MNVAHVLLLAVIVVAVAGVLYAVRRATRPAAPLLRSFKAGDFCYPCASPVDAQWGTVAFIAAYATPARAQRRFVFWNTSGQVMTVRSFTFGGYRRKYDGRVTEMIAPNLMQQYGYTNVVQPGEVFSLDPENDAHVMYKGWYNSPIFIAYALGAEALKYEVVGWAPMRLQDEKVRYKYFYDEGLRRRVLEQVDALAIEKKVVETAMGQRKDFEMARNAAIHWKTGGGYGGATHVAAISTDGNSQCSYVTEINTFDPVNVHVPLCHITVDFGQMTSHLSDVDNRAECLRNIAAVASAKIMDSAADLDNFIEPPDFDYAGLIADIIGISVYFYLQVAQSLATALAAAINLVLPGVGVALGIFVTALFARYRVILAAGGMVGGLIPGVGDELRRIGMTAAGFGESTWVQQTQAVAGLWFGMQRAALSALGANAAGGAAAFIEEAVLRLGMEAAGWAVLKTGGLAVEKYQEAANAIAAHIVEQTADKTDEMLLAMATQLVPKAKFRGRGKDDWGLGSSGRDGYALARKLWVNRELQKGKFAKDAACTGFWSVTYHDKPNPNAKPDDCTIL